MNRPKYYECGICGGWHRAEWNGDCREDAERFAPDQLDARHGAHGWEVVPMPGTEEPEVAVVFRKYREGGDILALFPEIDEGHGHCSSYQHVGQHGGADYNGCIACTVPAAPEEYAALKHELESAPYNYKLRVVQRRPAGR